MITVDPNSLQPPYPMAARRRHWWQRLVEPAPTVQEPALRRQAQLLLSLLIILLGFVAVGGLWAWQWLPSSLPVSATALAGLGVAYGLSRTERIRVAALLTVFVLSILPYWILHVSGNYQSILVVTVLVWIILPLWVASLLLSTRATAALTMAHIGGLLLLRLWVPEAGSSTLVFLMLFVGTTTALALTANHHRGLLEADRTRELQAALLRLEQELAQRQQAEAALQASEAQYRLLFESNPQPMWVYDRETLAFLAVNEAAIRQYGYSQAEFLGLTSKDIRPPEDVPKLLKRVSEVTETLNDPLLWRHKKKDGTLIDVEVRSHSLTFEGRRAALVMATDVTERQRVQAALQSSERHFRALIENAADAVALLAADGAIRYESPAATRLLGYSTEEFARMNAFDLLHPDDAPAAASLLGQVLQSPSQPAGTQFRYRRKDGAWRWVEAQGTNLLHDPDVGAVVVNYRDITERKQAEAQIQRQLERLAALRAIDIAITSSLDLRLTLAVLLEQVTAQLGVHAADVLLLDPNAQMLAYAAGRGFRTSALQQTQSRLGEGHAGRAALERRMVNVPDLRQASPQFRRTGLLLGEDFVSYFAVPLIAKGQVQGVLEVFHRAPLAPDPDWQGFLEALAGQAAIAIDSAQLFDSLQRTNSELTVSYDATIEGWSRALDLRDKETEGHSQRVTELTLRLAQASGVSAPELAQIRRGALLHDMGKLGVPDSILLKPGKLTDDEWAIMRQHPTYAYEMLAPITYLRPALDIPYCHHEKWDGTGYPRGLRGEQIPLAARLFAVVDVWDALRSDRPYRPAWSAEKVMEHMRSLAGTHFEPQVVDAFLRVMSRQ